MTHKLFRAEFATPGGDIYEDFIWGERVETVREFLYNC